MPKKSIYRQPGAQHFQLVHRSQRDPLIHDPDASQHVLKAFERENVRKGKTREDLEATLSPEDIQATSSRPNLGQASLYEIYYDDTEYDYMQHLRAVNNGQDQEAGVETIMLPAPAPKQSKGKSKTRDPHSFLKEPASDVPAESLPSTVELERDYEAGTAVPSAIAGFQPDMDRHLRQVLEALEDEAFVDDELEEDFFGELVKAGERDEDEEVDYDYDDEADEYDGDAPSHDSHPTTSSLPPPERPDDDWIHRFTQFKKEQAANSPPSDGADEDDVGSEGRDTITGLPRLSVVGGKRRRKGASDASGYSLTSSSMFRNEGLSTLDERFAKIEEEYASSDDGEGLEDDDTNTETISGSEDDDAPDLLGPREDFDSLLDDFLDKYEVFGGKMRPVLHGSSGAEKLETIRRAIAGDEGAADTPDNPEAKRKRIEALLEEARVQEARDGGESDDDDIPMPAIVGIGKDKDRWDVETILSTYSNLENHPRLIRARPDRPERTLIPPSTKQIRIELDPRTGLPRVANSNAPTPSLTKAVDSSIDGEAKRKAAVGRPKGESAEEKKARKLAVKEQRQTRRVEKKVVKEAFSNERSRQVKVQESKQDGIRKL